MRNEGIAVTNFCCFEKQYSHEVFENILLLYEHMKEFIDSKPEVPETGQWLYSSIVNPFAMSPGLFIMAGEVELYIYERLYKAKTDKT